MPDDWNNIDSRGHYGSGNSDAIIAGFILERLRGTDSGSGTIVLPHATGTAAAVGPQFLSRWIADLPNEPFVLIKSIPVIVEEHAPQEYTARFREANMAMSGESVEEALMNLAAHVLDVYEMLRDEDPELLGPEPQRQLTILRQYLRET